MMPCEQQRLLDDERLVPPFHRKFPEALHAVSVDILQVNVGRRCNLVCRHCHLDAGPDRPEVMGREVFEKCLEIIEGHAIGTIDITGGAPEMNPHLPWFIAKAGRLGRRLMVRTNLVILLEKDYQHFSRLYADNGVEVVASLPDYHRDKADRQRGAGAFDRIIDGMRLLNSLGYGKPGSGLALDLVYNPVGTYLPGAQHSLEHEYHTRLDREYGVCFNGLFCLANSPTGRFLEYLIKSENLTDYMGALNASFNQATVNGLMCRNTLSVGWDGRLFDCDFNQALDMPVACGSSDTVYSFDVHALACRKIVLGNHCYSCTAGAGSSCQGALST
jgi:radical SAM/Cys-rich protein